MVTLFCVNRADGELMTGVYGVKLGWEKLFYAV